MNFAPGRLGRGFFLDDVPAGATGGTGRYYPWIVFVFVFGAGGKCLNFDGNARRLVGWSRFISRRECGQWPCRFLQYNSHQWL